MKQSNLVLEMKQYQSYIIAYYVGFRKIRLNPSEPDVIFYTYPLRGGVITPPLVKSLFTIENHVFCSCGEI